MIGRFWICDKYGGFVMECCVPIFILLSVVAYILSQQGKNRKLQGLKMVAERAQKEELAHTELLESNRLRMLEREKKLQNACAKLHHTKDYELIERFAVKNRNIWSEKTIATLQWLCESGEGMSLQFWERQKASSKEYRELSNLRTLLEGRSHRLEEGELISLVAREMRSIRVKEGEKRILRSNPDSYPEILDSFLEVSTSQDIEMIESLSLAIRSRGLPPVPIPALKEEIEMLEKTKELRLFERNLLAETVDDGDDNDLGAIDSMSGHEFEEYVGKLFLKMGYSVEQTPQSRDQGADLVVTKYGERSSIQVKRTLSRVGNKAVQEVVASMSYYKAAKGIIATNSYFTSSAVQLAKVNGIQLIDRTELKKLIDKHQ